MLGRSYRSAALSWSSSLLSNQPSSAITTSAGLRVRKIIQSEDEKDKTTTIEGVHIPSKQTRVLQPPEEAKYHGRACGSQPDHVMSKQCHPFCRFDFVHQVKHTDVLILSQFMDSSGKIMNQEVTGLCRRQHQRVNKLIKMAAKSGLFPKHLDQFSKEKEEIPGANLKCYYDEKTIDIQYMNSVRQEARNKWRPPSFR